MSNYFKHVENSCCVGNRYNQDKNGVNLYELPNNLSDKKIVWDCEKKSKSQNLEKFCISK